MGQPIPILQILLETKKICLNCSEVEHLPIIEDNIVQVYAPKTRHFDMNQFVTSRLQEEDVQNIQCENCRHFGANYSTQFIETQKVMIIQLNFMDEFLTKKIQMYSPTKFRHQYQWTNKEI